MSSACDAEYGCQLTLVHVRSRLEGHDGCVIEVDSDQGSEHVVELWNLGSGSYTVDVEGLCEQPLLYPGSSTRGVWKTSKEIKLGPRLKSAPRRLRQRIAASSEDANGLEDHDVETVVSLTGRFEAGAVLRFVRKLPPDGPLTFSCRVE